MPEVLPEKGVPGEARLCEWRDAGDNGEPVVVYEDGSAAPFEAYEYEGTAYFNPKYRHWQAGWYPADLQRTGG